jgi:hypothetical protein
MSVLIFFTIKRLQPLSDEELALLLCLLDQFNQTRNPQCEDLFFTNLDSKTPTAGLMLTGSIKPTTQLEFIFDNMRHILKTLSAIRRALPKSDWTVTLGDIPIQWDEASGFYLG